MKKKVKVDFDWLMLSLILIILFIAMLVNCSLDRNRYCVFVFTMFFGFLMGKAVGEDL